MSILTIDHCLRAPLPLMISAVESTTKTLLKREDAGRFSLYVFAIIVGCVAAVLIGCGIWSMYNGDPEGDVYLDIPSHQRKYMREVRLRGLNNLAYLARRPDMVIPIDQVDY
ncbi:hypothetical protein N7468_002439 [Penicillium chermesinum]|uniref:Uncharacterized protein n=1 Tax=Penicillium chermesinum TaxID=63820 RepID=A0A9W9PII0_9EURO|nr:uncharacterized protein N7468_002439 [Penicillium chermesinum]KAJ5247456.1 hypothetical protein N7468_002439 [Penicillium chermesinum]KAJ6145694.1 hypothetical protein N7470_009589 [Penicillium chermesinum]